MLSAALVACAASSCTRRAASEAAPVVDGRFLDWPSGATLRADDEHLYVRLTLPEERTLQAAGAPLELVIEPALEIVFSPRDGAGQGVAVRALGGADDARARLGHAAVDLVVAPTFAAREFELRVAREVRGRPDLSAALAGGAVRVHARAERPDGSLAWRSAAQELRLPPRAARPGSASVAIPAAAEGALRVVSWNVHLAAPRDEPEPFARVLRALRPDVVLLQEWEGATADELTAWFAAHVPGEGAWRAVTSAGWGVALV
ncbi:MAG: hypothetical protein AB1689_22300, partial [Thermodesulfobacteriota bacterium]